MFVLVPACRHDGCRGQAVEAVPVDIEAIYRKSAIRSTASAGVVLGLGAISPNLAFSNMMTTFALSGIVGYQARETHTHTEKRRFLCGVASRKGAPWDRGLVTA